MNQKNGFHDTGHRLPQNQFRFGNPLDFGANLALDALNAEGIFNFGVNLANGFPHILGNGCPDYRIEGIHHRIPFEFDLGFNGASHFRTQGIFDGIAIDANLLFNRRGHFRCNGTGDLFGRIFNFLGDRHGNDIGEGFPEGCEILLAFFEQDAIDNRN